MVYHSAYEAGVCGNSIHYELENTGIHNIVFNPADIAQKDKERKRKTDKVDSSKIARALGNGELECIHIPTKERTEHRNMLRVRNCCISDVKPTQTNEKNKFRAVPPVSVKLRRKPTIKFRRLSNPRVPTPNFQIIKFRINQSIL